MPWISEEITEELKKYLQSKSSTDKQANKLNKKLSRETKPKTLNSDSPKDNIFLAIFFGLVSISLFIAISTFSPQIIWFLGTNFGIGGDKAWNAKLLSPGWRGAILVKAEGEDKVRDLPLCDVVDRYSEEILKSPETQEYLSALLEKGNNQVKVLRTQRYYLIFTEHQGKTVNVNAEMIKFLRNKTQNEKEKINAFNEIADTYTPSPLKPFGGYDCSYPYSVEVDRIRRLGRRG